MPGPRLVNQRLIERTVCDGQDRTSTLHRQASGDLDQRCGDGIRPGNPSPVVTVETRTTGHHLLIGWTVIGLYALWLLYRASHTSDATYVPLMELRDAHGLLRWMSGLAFKGLCDFIYLVPVGFVAALIVPCGRGWLQRFPLNLRALGVASLLAVLVHSAGVSRSGAWTAAVSLVLPWLGSLFGTWMGTTWGRGWHARLWLLPKTALLVLFCALCLFLSWALAVEETSLPFDSARVTSAEKRRLVELIRSKSPRKLSEGQIQTLILTEQDINVLLSWGLSLGLAEQKAQARLTGRSAGFSVSVAVPFAGERKRYVNLVAAGSTDMKEGCLHVRLDRCRIGAMEVPRWFLSLVSPVVTSLIRHDRRIKPFWEAIQNVSIEAGAVAVTYGPIRLPPGFREDLVGSASAGDEVLASTRAYVDHLLAQVRPVPVEPPAFSVCVETVFSLARQRSAQGDPIGENRAAIFALGLLLGHPRLEEFLGPVLESEEDPAARQLLGHVRLRGRSDWTKHFCLSAAITLLSDELVSDAAGLLKEELDSDVGGSGFSFADLLADRAGTTFALQATRDPVAARAMQDRIVRGFEVDAFFPPAADLPEGVSDAELQSSYGGVGGAGYRRLIEEIRGRVETCAAYRRQP